MTAGIEKGYLTCTQVKRGWDLVAVRNVAAAGHRQDILPFVHK